MTLWRSLARESLLAVSVKACQVVENYHSLTQEDVKKLVNEPKKGWDMVVFTVGCDPPRSNSVPDVIEQSLGPIWCRVERVSGSFRILGV